MTTRPPTHLSGPSRDVILDLLRWEPLTVEELADRVGLTPNGIRAQLTGLERDGLVEKAGLRHAGTAGKPPVLYAITRTAEGQYSSAYAPTLEALVRVMRERLEDGAFRALLTETGRQLGIGHRGRDPLRVLEALGGAVRQESLDSGGLQIEGAGCPLADAVREEPRTCEVVRSMLATAVGRDVTMSCQHGDSPRCCFEIEA